MSFLLAFENKQHFQHDVPTYVIITIYVYWWSGRIKEQERSTLRIF